MPNNMREVRAENVCAVCVYRRAYLVCAIVSLLSLSAFRFYVFAVMVTH